MYRPWEERAAATRGRGGAAASPAPKSGSARESVSVQTEDADGRTDGRREDLDGPKSGAESVESVKVAECRERTTEMKIKLCKVDRSLSLTVEL